MSLLQQAPRFDVDEAVRLAHDLYALDATASPLPSERDQNFLLTTSRGDRFVLKIANATESRSMLEAQNAALAHVASRVSFCPRIVPAGTGEAIATVPSPSGSAHLVRLVTYLDGAPLARVAQRTPTLLEDLGRRVGELDAALSDFDHPAIHRDFHWDLAGAAAVIGEHLPLVRDRELRGLVAEVSARALRTVAASHASFRRSAIHNDANDWNVLVAANRVVGIIDFGDMVAGWTVADLAVAAAYAVLDAPDPFVSAGHVVGGYDSATPLRDQERGALVPLVALRLCLSVCIGAWQQQQRADDEYLVVSQAAIRRTLPKLAARLC